MACKINIDCFDDEQLALIEKELTLPLKNIGIQQRFVYPFNLLNRMVYLPFSYATTIWDIPRPLRNAFSSSIVKFDGTLREEQLKVKNEAIANLNRTGSTLMSMYCGFGKCLGYDTPVLCFNGLIKKVQNIVVGDELMGDDSTPRRVMSLARGRDRMYRIDLDYGESFTANSCHVLSLYAIHHRKKVQIPNSSYIYTVHFDRGIMDYMWVVFSDKYSANHFLNTIDSDARVDISIEDFLQLTTYSRYGLMAYRNRVYFPENTIYMNPYFLGLWLGVGDEHTKEIKITEPDIIQYMTEMLEQIDIDSVKIEKNDEIEKITTRVILDREKSNLNKAMNWYRLFDVKTIPTDFLYNTQCIRLSVLAGLIDSCGEYSDTMYYIYLKTKRMCCDSLYLIRSLGFNCIWYDSLRKGVVTYVMLFAANTGPKIPVLLDKNQSGYYFQNENCSTLMNFSISPIGERDYYGFEIDGNHRFLLGDFTVTHNTITSINLACNIGLKTMIVMNRIVLMNQWEKSIKSVCSNAIIQKINSKSKKTDANFYIVNAINMPKMSDEWFDDIGTAIIDECFTYDTMIMTINGPKKIGDICSFPYYIPRVLSFNEREKRFEYKSVVDTFRKSLRKKLVTITFVGSFRKIDCTEDHMFLTLFDGYKRAKDLKHNDGLIARYECCQSTDAFPILSENQRQIIFACFLVGNITNEICNGRYTIRFENINTRDNRGTDYENLKHELFKMHENYAFFDLENRYFDADFALMAKEMNERSLAAWYMESYAYCHEDIILAYNISLKKHIEHILEFFKRYDLTVIVQVFEEIIFFVIHEKSVSQFEYLIRSYVWSHNLSDRASYFIYGCVRVNSVIDYNGCKQNYIYDIEVEGNHNFLIYDPYTSSGVVAHNCHAIVAETLSKSLLRLTPRYLIGLSATPYRPDEMDSLIKLYFGENKIIRELFRRHTVYMVDTKFKPDVKYLSNGKINWGSILDSQATNKERNDLIVKIVMTNRDRNFLILTKRVEQARYLIENLINEGENVTNLVGNKQDYEPSARILVATIQKVSCGFDHAKLDTLLLAADTEEYYAQVLGRIFRTQNVEPLVFDLVDDNPILRRHFEMRREVYRKHGGQIRYLEF